MSTMVIRKGNGSARTILVLFPSRIIVSDVAAHALHIHSVSYVMQIKEITELKAAYTSGAPSFRFQHLLLNVVDNPAQASSVSVSVARPAISLYTVRSVKASC